VHPRHRPLRKEALAFLRIVREAASEQFVFKLRPDFSRQKNPMTRAGKNKKRTTASLRR
jgi:hypothetical protein